jgi:hypothetical protein
MHPLHHDECMEVVTTLVVRPITKQPFFLIVFFFLNLNKLGFEELGTTNGVGFVVACDVGVVTCLNA